MRREHEEVLLERRGREAMAHRDEPGMRGQILERQRVEQPEDERAREGEDTGRGPGKLGLCSCHRGFRSARVTLAIKTQETYPCASACVPMAARRCVRPCSTRIGCCPGYR